MEALTRNGLPLPLSSLRLLVPPLRLVSAALWQVVQQRDVMDYGLVEEFVTTVLEIVPDMMSYRERVQLIMGLRAQLVLELCRSDHLANPETIQPHLNRMNTCIITHSDKEISDPEVEASESNFLKLIQTLLEDPVEKEHFFQSVFPEEFGPKYDSALQTLVWEFLSRLEKLLPAPTLQQTASWFLPDPSVLEECVECVSHPQPLKTLLQHHNNTCGHVDTNGLFSGDNQIPIKADPEVQSEPVQQCMRHVSSDNESEMTPLLELGIDSDQTVYKEVEPVHKEVEPVHKEVEPVHKEVEPVHKEVESASLEVSSTPRRERLQIGKVGSQGQRRGQVISRKSERNINEEPSDGQPQYSLAPDPSPTSGQPKRSKRVKICSLCRKTFNEAKDLTAHMRSHNEQSPYKFTQCGQDFEHHDDLQKHQQNVCEEAAQTEEDNMSTTSMEDQTELACTELSESSKARTCRVCHKTVYSRNYLRKHLKSQHGQLLKKHKTFFCCSLCNKTFGCRNYLRKHLESKHGQLLKMHKKNKNMICCTMCNKSFDLSEPNKCEVNQQQLPRKAQPEANTLTAAVIPQPSSTTSQNPTTSNALPIQAQFYNDYRTCLLCSETFDTAETMRKHLRFQHNILSYLCHDCGESFPSKLDLQKHSKNCLSIPDSRKCHECRKITPQTTQPQAKICLEMNQRQQQLPAAGNEMEIPQSLVPRENGTDIPQSHSTSPQNPTTSDAPPTQTQPPGISPPASLKSRTCPLCSKCFAYKKTMMQHLRRHSQGQGPFMCTICSKSFGTASDLKRHQGIKSGCGPNHRNLVVPENAPTEQKTVFSCPHCQGQYTSEKKMKAHMVCHTGEGFTCRFCGKIFAEDKKLRNHVRSHIDRRHLCDTCGKDFTSLSNLKKHTLVHTGEQPYICTDCGKSFSLKGNLKVHQQSHTGERPFACTMCKIRCFTQTHLKRHMLRHTGEKPHKCLACGKTFQRKNTLRKHQQDSCS
ncbi:zinc finger protein 26-like isoform X2 [Salvelinus namaycush]|uniref:Zinc finger protein 26-like isoform X2 n=1 Tax=Salvelinus namaycush TaxID=8040 RepID=A0A8U0TLF4_SALNM|nr:zinc finger protein 26-like isoform X2 [Salvelinus namaycush]